VPPRTIGSLHPSYRSHGCSAQEATAIPASSIRLCFPVCQMFTHNNSVVSCCRKTSVVKLLGNQWRRQSSSWQQGCHRINGKDILTIRISVLSVCGRAEAKRTQMFGMARLTTRTLVAAADNGFFASILPWLWQQCPRNCCHSYIVHQAPFSRMPNFYLQQFSRATLQKNMASR
jgi:hypothetical protein